MIPKNITEKHILKAIEEANRFGVPKGRNSRKFILEFSGRTYPPKYIISIANRYANRDELNPETFSGGPESNEFLMNLGFTIKAIGSATTEPVKAVQRNNSKRPRKGDHNERCPKCKETIRKLLERIYGKVNVNHKFAVGTLPEHFRGSCHYSKLKEIFTALQHDRGFSEFVRAKTLPNCDFFVPNPGFILDFDESQHFTTPRKKALERYPNQLSLGFDRKKWISLCDKTMASDNDPPYRDEQRAWYDTLRDFLPAIKGLKPTIRLYSKDFTWCSLDPDNESDVERFKHILKGETEGWDIKVIEEPSPTFARIIIARQWDGDLREAKNLLEQVCSKWPKGQKVKCILTCGGFLQFDWPKRITRGDIGDNRDPEKGPMNDLVKEAEECARNFLDSGLSRKLGKVADYITLGIDSYKAKISTTQNYIGELHVELVCLFDLRNHGFYWTGKSYPTNAQERGLVRISDLSEHFFNLRDLGKVMVLGCHDLNIFNNRNMTNTRKWRRNMKADFRALAQKKKPSIVLHHPHTTVTKGTWRNAWSTMRNIIPSVRVYAGAGRYYEDDRKRADWDDLNDVLEATKKNANSIDFIAN